VRERIAGKYWMYFLGTAKDNTDQVGLASSTDLLHWTEETDAPVLPVRAGMFDARVADRDRRRLLLRRQSFLSTMTLTTGWCTVPVLLGSTGTTRTG
jgi:hypothetical protein